MSSNWISCIQYLTKANIFPTVNPKDNLPWNEKNPRLAGDVVACLRDGVILNKLLFRIFPRLSIGGFVSRPNDINYLCESNIKLFLDASSSILKKSTSLLFSLDDLYSESYIKLQKVLQTISLISKTPESENYLGPGFSIMEETPPIPPKNFLKMNSKPPPCSPPIAPYRRKSLSENDMEEEEIYQRFISVKSQNRKKLSEKYRVNELVNTEEDFVGLLLNIIKIFKEQLENVLPKEIMETIFYKIEDLYQIHSDFLECLKNSLLEDSRLTPIENFLPFLDRFLIYGEYCSNIPNLSISINQCLNNNKYLNAIQKCEKQYKNWNISFKDLFIIPFQRILKYPLFLKGFVNETDPKDPKYRIYISVYQAVMDLADYVNEIKRDNELITNIKSIQKSIINLDQFQNKDILLNNWGRLIKDGEFKINKKPQSCFLFNFLFLVFTKNKDNTLILNNYFQTNFLDVNQNKNNNDKFFLIYEESEKKKLILNCKTKSVESSQAWVDAIIKNKTKILPHPTPGGHYFRLYSYITPTICDFCKKFLKGVICQGYRCEDTNTNCHEKCLKEINSTNIISPKGTDSFVFPPINENQRNSIAPNVSYLESKPWYAGEMEKETANGVISNLPDGSFLVRKNQEQSYRIDLKYNVNSQKVQKIIIIQSPYGYSIDNKVTNFTKIEELIKCYETVSLNKAYSQLTTKLMYPYKKVLEMMSETNDFSGFLCKALYSYTPEETNSSILTLKEGDIIEVLNTEVGEGGWWQGRLNNSIGYLPSNYVEFL